MIDFSNINYINIIAILIILIFIALIVYLFTGKTKYSLDNVDKFVNAVGEDTFWTEGLTKKERVEAARIIENEDGFNWTHEVDVAVVGLGGAGVACALQSLEEGLSVLAIDRFEGGGATCASGGVIYAGGGTPIQKAAGVDDDVDNMCGEAFHFVRNKILEDPSHPGCHINVFMLAKTLERIGDRSINIAEEVIHLVEGTIVRNA